MKISDRNFVSSQIFYGIAIARDQDMPSIHDNIETWREKLNALAKLSVMGADIMLAESRRAKRKVKRGRTT